MKVSTEEIENRQAVVTIEVDDERMEKALEQAYRRLVGRLNVPGFRKGKAPRSLVERMIGREALLEDAIEHLVPVVYREAIQAEGLKPVAQPQLEVLSAEPLQVKATVPLEPRVELGRYQEIQVSPESTEVGEEEVARVIERLRESHAEWVPVERSAQVGDRVGLDIKATAAEKTFLDSKDAEYELNPDGPEPAPGFSGQLVGMEAGQERSFPLALAEGLRDSDLAGQQATFEVTLHWVKEKQLPELDDALASAVGEFETVEALRSEVERELGERKREASSRKVEEDAIQAAVAGSTLEVPPQMIEQEADRLREQLERSLDRQGINIEQYLRFTQKSEGQFRAELEAEAEQSVRRSAVLSAVAKAEKLEVSDGEVEEEIRTIAEAAPDTRRAARNALARPEIRERVRSALLERKAVRRLVALATGDQVDGTLQAAVEQADTALQTGGDQADTTPRPASEQGESSSVATGTSAEPSPQEVSSKSHERRA